MARTTTSEDVKDLLERYGVHLPDGASSAEVPVREHHLPASQRFAERGRAACEPHGRERGRHRPGPARGHRWRGG